MRLRVGLDVGRTIDFALRAVKRLPRPGPRPAAPPGAGTSADRQS